MKRLNVTYMGDDVRVALPYGDIDITRCDNGDYWVHVRVNRAGDMVGKEPYGKVIDARLDIEGKSVTEADIGDFADPGLYHMAVRVAKR